MFKSAVYQGNSLLGEAEMYPQNQSNGNWNKEIRISHLSPPSDRCPPLAILHTIATAGVCFRMESKSAPSDDSPLFLLHATCLRENKTAVVSRGESELHLVAMPSRKSFEKYSCFWGFNVSAGLYNSCLIMLNMRCLGIVFDLDETLIVANTMRSFEDRIDALQRKINSETDPMRVSGMLAEVKRYQDDKSILKQYVENDQIIENGKIYNVHPEIVPPSSNGQQPIVRPIIRLQERNIILTRVNPAIRDTSVLVRLRPAWEDLRNYLTAKGRKRFEVYVCTMAERDYALEMWRLLDPESNLINANQLLDRIVCVKSGLKKSLFNVFQNGICHPKMALVIDDRLKVWDDKDQPRVHVVPAFAPYYAPQAETNGAVPVLCVARNVACNVRGSFFKEFDEGLLPRISGIFYEDEISVFPSAPDVGNYLLPEDDSVSNGNKDTAIFDGMPVMDAERRFNVQVFPAPAKSFDPRMISYPPNAPSDSLNMVSVAATPSLMPSHSQFSQNIVPVKPLGHSGLPESSIQSSPVREEGEVPESELDPDTRRRLLILQHGQDTREQCNIDPPLPVRPLVQPPVPPPVQTHGSWFPLDEDNSLRQINRVPKEYLMESEPINFERKGNNQSFFRGLENSSRSDRGFYESSNFPKRAYHGDDRSRTFHSSANYESFQDDEMPNHISSNSKEVRFESRRVPAQYPESSVAVLEEIAMKCGANVEYRTALVETLELQFTIEVWFIGEKIGEGVGKTRRDAQRQAVDCSLKALADKYLGKTVTEQTLTDGDLNKLSYVTEKGFARDPIFFGYSTESKDDNLAVASTLDQSQFTEFSRISSNPVSALKALCSLEGYHLVFKDQPSISTDTTNNGEAHAEVEVSGKVLGKGSGITWEEAKMQASEEALAKLKPLAGQYSQKRVSSLRPYQAAPNKRFKTDIPRVMSRASSSSRYSRKDTFVP